MTGANEGGGIEEDDGGLGVLLHVWKCRISSLFSVLGFRSRGLLLAWYGSRYWIWSAGEPTRRRGRRGNCELKALLHVWNC